MTYKTLYTAYFKFQNQYLCAITTNPDALKNYVEHQPKAFKEYSLNLKLVTKQLKPRKDKELLNAVNYVFKDDDSIRVIKNIRLEKELEIWLRIEAGLYTPTQEWDIFLNDNHLLKSWINGNLQYTLGRLYSENSRYKGSKFKYTETYSKDIKSHLVETNTQNHIFENTYDCIWSFEKFFNGHNSKLSVVDKNWYIYNSDYKIVTIKCENKFFHINTEWHNQLKKHLYKDLQSGVVSV